MRKIFTALLTLFVAAGLAGAQGLDGKKIEVTGTSQDSIWTPVTVAYDGPEWKQDTEVAAAALNEEQIGKHPRPVPPESYGTPKVFVVDAETGNKYGATVRAGELVFVPGLIPANARRVFTVEVANDMGPAAVQTIRKADADEIGVLIGNSWFTSYFFDNDDRKPYLWPVLAEDGAHLTRDWPMGPPVNSADHVHHKSIWTAYGEVNGFDLWGEESDRSGWQHTDSVENGSGGGYGWISAKNIWQTPDHKPIVSEAREYRFYNIPGSIRLFDATITLTADYGGVEMKDTKEGGMMAVRVSDIMDEKAGTGGVMTMSGGRQTAKNCWGKASPWCDYSGPINGKVYGLAIFDNPQNLRHPTRWHARDYGLLTANAFGYSHFTKNEEKQERGDFTLKNGESLVFKYRVYIHDGGVDEAKVPEHYAGYIDAPKAEWVN